MEILDAEQEQKIQEWLSDKAPISILIESTENRIKAAHNLVDRLNLSVSKKPGVFMKPEGDLALYIDSRNMEGFHPGSKLNLGNFMAKVGDAIIDAARVDGLLGRNGRISNAKIESLKSGFGTAEGVMAALHQIKKEAKLNKVVVVCPEMDLLLPDSFSRVVSEFSGNELDSGIELKGGMNSARSDVTKDVVWVM